MSEFTTVCRTDDVPEGEARMFVIGETQIGIFHINGDFLAINNRCPHAGASLAHGFIDGETVSCRIHHWRFGLRDGKRLDESCPQTDVKCFQLRVVGDEVQVEICDETS